MTGPQVRAYTERAAFEAAAASVAADGDVRAGFELPAEPFNLTGAGMVCVGDVDTVDAQERALVAALRGCRLVVFVAAADPVEAEAFADALRRAAPEGAHDPPARAAAPARPGALDLDTAELLDRLAAGESIAAAARDCLMSLRTANRRLAAARKDLGVATTRQAVLAHVRARADGS